MVAKNGNTENQTPETAVDASTSTTVEPIDGFDESTLRDLTSMSDVLALTKDRIPNIAEVLGNGFEILDNKMRLVDVEFVIVRYGEHKSDKGSKGTFATIHVITSNGNKYVVNDGSTGIQEQLKEIKEEHGRVAPLYVPRGLRVSEYDYTDEKGNTSKAQTFYLNTAK